MDRFTPVAVCGTMALDVAFNSLFEQQNAQVNIVVLLTWSPPNFSPSALQPCYALTNTRFLSEPSRSMLGNQAIALGFRLSTIKMGLQWGRMVEGRGG